MFTEKYTKSRMTGLLTASLLVTAGQPAAPSGTVLSHVRKERLMKLTCRRAVHAVLLTGCLLVAMLSSNAQADPPGGHAQPIANGQGVYVDQSLEVFSFTFSVVELPDGSVEGHGSFFDHVARRFILFELSSFMFVDGSLGVAGEITMAVNSPPQLAVGSTIFFFVNDNNPDTDAFAGLGLVPPEFGELTIQEIVGLIGPPPPDAFTPLVAGDIRIFPG